MTVVKRLVWEDKTSTISVGGGRSGGRGVVKMSAIAKKEDSNKSWNYYKALAHKDFNRQGCRMKRPFDIKKKKKRLI